MTSSIAPTKLTHALDHFHHNHVLLPDEYKLKVRRSREKYFDQELSISFQRTVRVADNGATNSLPPGLGDFPIYETKHYEERLPKAMAGKGGYFIPMYRMHPHCLCFSTRVALFNTYQNARLCGSSCLPKRRSP